MQTLVVGCSEAIPQTFQKERRRFPKGDRKVLGKQHKRHDGQTLVVGCSEAIPQTFQKERRRFPKGDRKALGKQHKRHDGQTLVVGCPRSNTPNFSKGAPKGSRGRPESPLHNFHEKIPTSEGDRRRSPEGDGQALWNKHQEQEIVNPSSRLPRRSPKGDGQVIWKFLHDETTFIRRSILP